jgi:hypothetical protein
VSKARYEPGEKITSLDELVKQDFIYWNDKITHRSWAISWQIHMALSAIESGIIRYAKLKGESK